MHTSSNWRWCWVILYIVSYANRPSLKICHLVSPPSFILAFLPLFYLFFLSIVYSFPNTNVIYACFFPFLFFLTLCPLDKKEKKSFQRRLFSYSFPYFCFLYNTYIIFFFLPPSLLFWFCIPSLIHSFIQPFIHSFFYSFFLTVYISIFSFIISFIFLFYTFSLFLYFVIWFIVFY